MRRFRAKHHLSQREMAERVGIDLFYYSKIERGVRVPGRVVAVRIAAATKHAVGVESWDVLKSA